MLLLLWSSLLLSTWKFLGVQADRKIHGALRPENPEAVAGEALRMTCRLISTVDPAGQPLEASNLHFTIEDSAGDNVTVIPESFTYVYNTTTLNLIYPVKLQDHWMLLCCFYGHQNKPLLRVGSCQRLVVGMRPFTPIVVDQSISLINWEKLYFTWFTEDVNRNKITNYTAWWRESTDEQYQECNASKSRTNTCMVDLSPRADLLNREFIVKVNATNDLGTSESKEHQVLARDIFKPAEVTDLKLACAKFNSLKIMFWTPKRGKMITYQMSCEGLAEWDRETKEKLIPATAKTSLEAEFEGLKPYTVYRICVKSQAKDGGKWSDQNCLNASTDESVPSMAPPVTASGYDVQMDGKYRSVNLYWKRVPDKHRNGQIIGYRIRYQSDTSGRFEEIAVPAEQLQANVSRQLRRQTPYHFYLEATTSVGYGKITTYPITVVAEKDAPVIPDNFTVIAMNSSAVQLSWKSNPSLDRVTVFWCYGSLKCMDELNWHTVAANETQVIRTGLNPRSYIYGIASETSDANTGIHWSDPLALYNITQVSAAPELEVKKATESTIWLQFRRPRGEDARGFIYMYRVYVEPPPSGVYSGQPLEYSAGHSNTALYKITGLHPETQYRVEALSVTAAGVSPYRNSLTTNTASPGGLSQTIIGVIIAGSVVLAALCIAGVYKSGRWLCKFPSLFKEPIKLPQKVPADHSPTYQDLSGPAAYTQMTSQASSRSSAYPAQSAVDTDPSAVSMTGMSSEAVTPTTPTSTTQLLPSSSSILPELNRVNSAYNSLDSHEHQSAVNNRSNLEGMAPEYSISMSSISSEVDSNNTSYKGGKVVPGNAPDFSSPAAEMSFNEDSGWTLPSSSKRSWSATPELQDSCSDDNESATSYEPCDESEVKELNLPLPSVLGPASNDDNRVLTPVNDDVRILKPAGSDSHESKPVQFVRPAPKETIDNYTTISNKDSVPEETETKNTSSFLPLVSSPVEPDIPLQSNDPVPNYSKADLGDYSQTSYC